MILLGLLCLFEKESYGEPKYVQLNNTRWIESRESISRGGFDGFENFWDFSTTTKETCFCWDFDEKLDSRVF